MQIQRERERTRKQRTKCDFPRSICCSAIIMVKSVAPSRSSLLIRSFCQICFITGHKGGMQSMNTITIVITIPNVITHCHYRSSHSHPNHHYHITKKTFFLPQIRTNLTAKSRQPTDVLRRLTIAVELSH